ncbi:MAG: hypothetical protein LBN25_01275 [Christensenellaceae bacterium]|jgi:hypothetical protein|nr:hypothetical protein [Christensenellaceae bacterium]
MRKLSIGLLKVLKLAVFLCGFPLLGYLVYSASADSIALSEGYGVIKPWELWKIQIRDLGAFDMDLPWPFLGIIVFAVILLIFTAVYLITGSISKRSKESHRKSAIRFATAVLVVASVAASATVWFTIDRVLPGILDDATQGTLTAAEIRDDPVGMAKRQADLLNSFIEMNVANGNIAKDEVDALTEEYYFEVDNDLAKRLIELSGWSASTETVTTDEKGNTIERSHKEYLYSELLFVQLRSLRLARNDEIAADMQSKPIAINESLRSYARLHLPASTSADNIDKMLYAYLSPSYQADISVRMASAPKSGLTMYEATYYIAHERAVNEITPVMQKEGIKNSDTLKLVKTQFKSIDKDGYASYRGPLIDFANGGRLTIPVLIHLLLDDRLPSSYPFYVEGAPQYDGSSWIVLDMTPDPIAIPLGLDLEQTIVDLGILDLLKFDIYAVVQGSIVSALEDIVKDPNVLGAPAYLTLKATNANGNFAINRISVYDPDFKELASNAINDAEFAYASAYDFDENGVFVGDQDVLGTDVEEATIVIKLIASGSASKGTHDYMRMAWLDSNALLVGIISLYHLREIMFWFSAVLVVVAIATGLLRYLHYGTANYRKYLEEKAAKKAARREARADKKAAKGGAKAKGEQNAEAAANPYASYGDFAGQGASNWSTYDPYGFAAAQAAANTATGKKKRK